MKPNRFITVFVTIVAFCVLLARAAEPAGVLKVDPVELIRGHETPGKETIHADHFRFRYLFASEENKAEFLKNPANYEIQLGGACGRMGALSGIGSTDIYAVFDDRVYIFASEACRKTFQRDPQRVIEMADPPPATTDESTNKGKELLEKAVTAMGGSARIDRFQRYEHHVEKDTESNEKTHHNVKHVTFELPDRVRYDNQWNEAAYTHVVAGKEGWFKSASESFPLHEQQREALWRQTIGRNLLAILKARSAPGTVVSYLGAGEIDENGEKVAVENVAIAFGGATNTLAIDPQSGRIVSQSFRGQGPDVRFGKIERRFSDHRTIDGVNYPVTMAVLYEGEPIDESPVTLKAIRIDGEIDPSVFRAPQ